MPGNPLIGMLQNGGSNPINMFMNNMGGRMNPMQIIQAFNQFKQSMNITPAQAKAKIESAVNAGQITWEQVEQMKQFAQSIGLK